MVWMVATLVETLQRMIRIVQGTKGFKTNWIDGSNFNNASGIGSIAPSQESFRFDGIGGSRVPAVDTSGIGFIEYKCLGGCNQDDDSSYLPTVPQRRSRQVHS